VSQPDAVSRRQPIHGIKDMPSGYDAEVAELFRDLRAATALSEMELAARIGTRPEVVEALEQGALQALPPWAETCRVVNAYGTMLNLDVRPLLRRIYAQLEAGIVELQPKPFPEVPTMTPPDSDDFGFGSGAPAGGPAPNPLDIPWPPPQQQAPSQRQAWPNAGPPPAPQARRPNAAGIPQPQTMRPRPQGGPQPSQAWPGGVQPMPQAPRPAPGQRPAPPQPQMAQRPPQPRPAQPPPQQPQAQPPRQPQPSEAEMLEAAFGPGAAQKEPEPKKKRGRSRLLKLGIVVLILAAIAAVLAGLYVFAPGTVGNAPATTTDPDDPRSKKTDRLPEAPPPPAQ
jgi:hypothetical protein